MTDTPTLQQILLEYLQNHSKAQAHGRLQEHDKATQTALTKLQNREIDSRIAEAQHFYRSHPSKKIATFTGYRISELQAQKKGKDQT